MNKSIVLAAAAALSLGMTAEAAARDQIQIVGSSTVFPFTTTVAETFAKTSGFAAPVIESTGTGGGMKLFCAGVGVEHPDFTGASRAIKSSEIENCAANGVTEIVEMKIGYDGIVVAGSKAAPQLDLSKQQLFLALAKQVPVNGQLVDNPYKTWQEIDASLPDQPIRVYGPPPTSGTRDAFVELVMDEACAEMEVIQAIEDKDAKKAACQAVREDGGYVEAGENDTLIVQKLVDDKNALGIFGFSFLDQNADKIHGSLVEGVEPTFENIAAGEYTVSRPLFVYAKKAHVGVVPGMAEFIAEYTSEKAWGPEGYLADKGLIPLPEDERNSMGEKINSLTVMNAQ